MSRSSLLAIAVTIVLCPCVLIPASSSGARPFGMTGRSTALGALAGGVSLASSETPDPAILRANRHTLLPDPFPIVRILQNSGAGQYPALLKQHEPIRRMTRDEFESAVQRAAAHKTATNTPPQLIQARYSARLQDGTLSGTGEWSFANTSGAGGVVNILPVGIAIQNPRWPTADAILFHKQGNPDTSVTLLIPDAQSHTVHFEWSANGTSEPHINRYEIMVPVAAISTFDLELPQKQEPVLTQNILIKGPFPGKMPGWNRWTFSLGEITNVNLGIRMIRAESEDSPPLRYNIDSEYYILPNEMRYTARFGINTIQNEVSTIAFEIDPDLHILDVATETSRQPVTWSIASGQTPKAFNVLQLKLPETIMRETVTITAVGNRNLTFNRPGMLPAVSVLNGIPETDTITILLNNELRLVTCDPRDYRIQDSEPNSEQNYRMLLVGSFSTRPGPDSRRSTPIIAITTADVVMSMQEEQHWFVDAAHTSLIADIHTQIHKGPCARFQFQIPRDYNIKTVELEPADSSAQWEFNAPQRLLTILPSHAIATGESLGIHINATGPPVFPDPGHGTHNPQQRTIPFPGVTPLNPSARDGTYTISTGRTISASLFPLPEVSAQRSQINNRAVVKIPFSHNPPMGALYCTLPLPDTAVQFETQIASPSVNRKAAAVHHITIQSLHGSPDHYDILLPKHRGEVWSLQVESPFHNNVRKIFPESHATTLHHLRQISAWTTLTTALAASADAFEIWRVTTRNMGKHPLRILATVTADHRVSQSGSVQVSVPTICGIDPSVYHFNVSDDRNCTIKIHSILYRPFPVLSLLSQSSLAQGSSPARAEYSNIQWLAHLQANGFIRHTLSGNVSYTPGTPITIGLPPESQLLSVSCDGKQVTGLTLHPTQPDCYQFPLPSSLSDDHTFQIIYQHHDRLSGIYSIIRESAPDLSGNRITLDPEWTLDPGYLSIGSIVPSWLNVFGKSTERVVIRSAVISALGYMVASVLLGLGIGLMKSRRRSGRAVIAVAVIAIGVFAWIVPVQGHPLVVPPLTAGLLLLSGYWISRPNSQDVTGSTVSYTGNPFHIASYQNNRTTIPPATMFLVATIITGYSISSRAQPPDPAVVVLSATRDSSGATQWNAMVPQSVMDRLDQSTRSVFDTVVITSAEYTGSISQSTASLEAVYRIYNPSSSRQILSIPLSKIRISRVLLDSATVLPDLKSQDRYTITINGAGFHTVRVFFDVPVTSTGGESELRFGTPNTPSSRISLQLPQNSLQARILTARGDQAYRDGRIHADLGPGNEFVIKWRGIMPDSQSVISAREASVWDLYESFAILTTALNIRIDGGSESHFRIVLPSDLEPGNIIIRSTDPNATDSQPGLQDWQLLPGVNGTRILHLTLRSPVSGRITVLFQSYPRSAYTARPALQFPHILGVSDVESYYALRARSVHIEDVNRTGMIDYPADSIFKDFGTVVPELDLEQYPVTRLFRNADGARPRLVPVLKPVVPQITGSADVRWDIGDRLQAHGTIRMASPSRPRGWIDFELPAAVVLHDVRTPDLLGWGRTGNRVQVWLQQPATQAVVQWSGQLQPLRYQAGEPVPVPLTLPIPRFGTSGHDATVTLNVTTANGWTVEPGESDHLVPYPVPAGGPGNSYLLSKPVPSVPFLGFPPQAPGGARILDTFEKTHESILYQSIVDIPVRPGHPQTVTLGLSGHGPDAGVELLSTSGAQLAPVRSQPGDHAWSVRIGRNVASSIRLTLTLRQPVSPDPRIPLATLWLGDAPYPIAERLLLCGRNIQVAYPKPIHWGIAAPDLARLQALYPVLSSRFQESRVARVPMWFSYIRFHSASMNTSSTNVILPDADHITAHPPLHSSNTAPLPPASNLKTIWPWTGLASWILGVMGLCFYLPRPSQWPYRLVVSGILGAAALGTMHPAGRFFLALIAIGVLVVLIRILMRLSAHRR